jgi:hypothetical protein
MNFQFLREEIKALRTQMTFVGSSMEIFIPSYFLDKNENIANYMGNRVESVGLFWFKVGTEFYELQLPVKIQFEFTETYKKKMKLMPGMPSEDYIVFVLKTGDAFVYDINHKQDSDDFNWFIDKLIEGAKLPPSVSYDEVFNLFSRALQITNINNRLGVPFLSIEFMLSELFRKRGNTSIPFRKDYDGKKNPYGYKMLRITKVPENNGTFTSLIGEDLKQQLISSVLRNREGKVDRISPLEKVLKY